MQASHSKASPGECLNAANRGLEGARPLEAVWRTMRRTILGDEAPRAFKGNALRGIQRPCAQRHSKAMPRGISPHELIKRKDLGDGVGEQLIRHSRRDPAEAHRATRVAYGLDVVAAEDAVRVWVRV